MLLFRSEDDITGWCTATGEPRGAAVPLETVWQLSQRWYGDRLEPTFAGRTTAQAEAIFASVGLSGEFWRAE